MVLTLHRNATAGYEVSFKFPCRSRTMKVCRTVKQRGPSRDQETFQKGVAAEVDILDKKTQATMELSCLNVLVHRTRNILVCQPDGDSHTEYDSCSAICLAAHQITSIL